jgi:hypothetical protein
MYTFAQPALSCATAASGPRRSLAYASRRSYRPKVSWRVDAQSHPPALGDPVKVGRRLGAAALHGRGPSMSEDPTARRARGDAPAPAAASMTGQRRVTRCRLRRPSRGTARRLPTGPSRRARPRSPTGRCPLARAERSDAAGVPRVLAQPAERRHAVVALVERARVPLDLGVEEVDRCRDQLSLRPRRPPGSTTAAMTPPQRHQPQPRT